MKNRPAVQLLVVGLLAAGAIGLAFWLRPSTNRYQTEGFGFDFPAAWQLHDEMPATTGFGQPLAVLGTVPWGPCLSYDLNCHYEQKLAPGQIEVNVTHLFLMSEDGFCGYAQERPDIQGRGPTDPQVTDTSYFRISGRPAIYTQYAVNGTDYYVSDEWRTWMVAPWDSTRDVFEINAKFRGPGDDDFRAALARLVESISLPPHFGPGYPAASPCGDPFPAL